LVGIACYASVPASGPRSRGARAHPPPHQGLRTLPRRSAVSALVLATQRLGGITGWGTDVFVPRQIERDSAGGVRLRLHEGDVLLLRELLGELEAMLDDPDDPALRRLFPKAHDDPASEEQYRSLVHDQLVEGRSKAAATMRDTLRKDTLSADEADAWLRALNDLRLLLGTRLDVTEDLDYENIDLNEPRGRDLAVYGYLTWLQEQLVEALAAG
jgi:hypothetical protein